MKRAFLLILLVITLNSQIAAAESYNLYITAELVDGERHNIENVNEIPLDQNLGIHFQIINRNNFWINPRSLQLRIKATENDETFFPLTSSIMRDELLLSNIYIPPDSENDIYVILENYNSLAENERSGSWELLFDVYASGTNCFYSDSLTDINYLDINTIKPNNIVFQAKNEVPESKQKFSIDLSDIAEKITPLNTIIGFLIGLVTLAGIIQARKK